MIYVYIAVGVISLILLFLIINKLGTIGVIALVLGGIYLSSMKQKEV
jgi:predicted membrane channel-forming protein YqfA (hemolysin III family)